MGREGGGKGWGGGGWGWRYLAVSPAVGLGRDSNRSGGRWVKDLSLIHI